MRWGTSERIPHWVTRKLTRTPQPRKFCFYVTAAARPLCVPWTTESPRWSSNFWRFTIDEEYGWCLMLWSTPLSPLSNSSISCNNSIHKVNLQQTSNVILMQCASQKTVLGNSPLFEYSLKTNNRQFDNVVVTGGTVSCHNDNLWCHQWRQSCQIDDLFGHFVFSVLMISNS